MVFLVSVTASADGVVSLGNETSRHSLIPAVRILEDPDGKWDIDQVSSPPLADRFGPIVSRFEDAWGLDLGVSPSVWWVRFDVRGENPAAGERNWVMVLSTHRFIGEVTIYSATADHWDEATTTRWNVQQLNTDQQSQYGKRVVFKLPRIGTTPRRVFARVSSDYYLYFPLSIWTASEFVDTTEHIGVMVGLFNGVLIVIALLNLLLVIFLREKSSLWYLFFVFFIWFYFSGLRGETAPAIKLFGPMYYSYAHIIGICGINFFCILFTRSFLHTKEFTPRIDKALIGYLLLTLVVLVISPYVSIDYERGFIVLQRATIVLGILAPLGTIAPAIVRLLQGFKPARLYLAAWSAFAISAFIFAVPWLAPTDGWRLFQLGSLLNVLLLTLAIVDRLRILRLEREALSAAKDTAEAALSESEERFRSVAEATTAHIAVMQDNRFVYANQTFLENAGVTWAELKQQEITEFFSPEAVRVGLEAWNRAYEQGETQVRYEYRYDDGRWFEVNASLVELDGNDAFITTSFDITEHKLAQQQMFRAEKMASLGQVIAGVAHEINNPNNFIYFNLPILKKYIDSIRPFLDQRARDNPRLSFLNMPYDMFIGDLYKLLENMQHGSSRITGIVSELKNYVRSSDEEDKSSHPLDELIQRVMTLVGKQVRKLVQRFEVDVAPGLPRVNINPGKIEQVLINLVINAGQASDKEDAWVKLTAGHPGGDCRWIEVRVEDNGSGISAEDRHRIFEPFFTTKADEAGTGLGLAISHQIVQDHGGELTVESRVGQGTTFAFRLPVTDPDN